MALLPKSFSRPFRNLASVCCVPFLFACGAGIDQTENAQLTDTLVATAGQIVTKSTYVQALVPTVYRFAKISNGAYFYTGSDDEVQQIIRNYPDFRYEGPAFERDISGGGQPVYRFANTNTGGYFYTGSEAERDQVLANYPHFRFEGSTFSVAPSSASDSRPVYRLANLNNGAYLYTLSAPERDYASSLGTWRPEGVSFRAPRGSPLSDRRFLKAGAMESGDEAILDYQIAIDDQGRAVATFVKNDGTRNVLFATRGIRQTGGEILWTSALPIDVSANGSAFSPYSPSYNRTSLDLSPNGNGLATWVYEAPCTTTAYSTFTGSNCRYIGYATYSASTGVWSTAAGGPSTPSSTYPVGFTNNAGDIAVLFNSWERSGTTSYTNFQGVAWLPAGQVTMQVKTFVGLGIYEKSVLTLDGSGNMLVAAQIAQNSTNDVVGYKGSQGAGFGTQVLIDQRGSAAELLSAATSSSGKSVIAYRQNNGVISNAIFIATLGPADINWSVVDVGAAASTTSDWIVSVSDLSVGRLMRIYSGQLFSDASGSWRSIVIPTLTNNISFGNITYNRNGDFVATDSQYSLGRWVSFDARRNVYTQASIPSSATGSNIGFIYGFAGGGTSWTSNKIALSGSGQGLIATYGQYDTFPTAQVPFGDGRSGVKSLWGLALN